MLTEKSQLKGHHRFQEAPPSHARQLKTAISTTAKPKTASSHTPKRKNTSAPLLDHILDTPTTLIAHTSDVGVRSTTSAISSPVSLWPRRDFVVWGWSTTCRGTTLSVVLSTVPSLKLLEFSRDAHSPRFSPAQMNSSGGGHGWPFLGLNDACEPLPLSLLVLNSRRPKLSASCWPAHTVVGGFSHGKQYQNAREDHIDCCITSMENDHLADIMETFSRAQVLSDFTTNPNTPPWYDQLVTMTTWRYNTTTYLRAVDFCLASITSTQSNSPISKFALIDSPLDELSWDNYLTFVKIENCLTVSFITINKTVMVDDTYSEIQYIITNPLNLKWTWIIRVKQKEEDREP